jgi:predicted ester cyclase
MESNMSEYTDLERTNIANVREFMERAFHQGDLAAIDELAAANGVDHQESPGTDYRTHLKQVITAMRTAFPDLHFEIHDILADGDIVSFRSTMTGTHLGTLSVVPGRSLPATGRRVSVPHMHFIRVQNKQSVDLWHQWNVPMMMMQLGVATGPQPAEAHQGKQG